MQPPPSLLLWLTQEGQAKSVGQDRLFKEDVAIRKEKNTFKKINSQHWTTRCQDYVSLLIPYLVTIVNSNRPSFFFNLNKLFFLTNRVRLWLSGTQHSSMQYNFPITCVCISMYFVGFNEHSIKRLFSWIMALQTDSGPNFESKSFFIFDALTCDGVRALFLLCATIFPENIEAVIGWKGGWWACSTECVRSIDLSSHSFCVRHLQVTNECIKS